MQIKIENNVATIPAGRGYWDLSSYNWGGSFRRLAQPVAVKISRIMETYSDGSPRKFETELNGKKVGFDI